MNRYEPPRTPEQEAESELLFEEMLTMTEAERDRLVSVEAARYVAARRRLTLTQAYRVDRRSALARCITYRALCRKWYTDGQPVESDHFLRESLRTAQTRLVQLRAHRVAGHTPSGLQ